MDLRQWVLTFPFAWRRRLAQNAELFSALTRIFVQTVLVRIHWGRWEEASI